MLSLVLLSRSPVGSSANTRVTVSHGDRSHARVLSRRTVDMGWLRRLSTGPLMARVVALRHGHHCDERIADVGRDLHPARGPAARRPETRRLSAV